MEWKMKLSSKNALPIILIGYFSFASPEAGAVEIIKTPYRYPSDMEVAIEAAETFVLCDCKAAPPLAVKPREIPIALKVTEPFHFTLPAPIREEPVQEEGGSAGGGEMREGEPDSTLTAPAGDDSGPAIILFGFNEKRITPEQEKEILKAADRIKKSGGEVNVFGHTCDLGGSDQNDRISRERAERVAAILKERAVTVAEIAGKGSCCPRSTDRRLNRRVEIFVTKNGGDHEK
ncbi:OmpA family protein [Nitrospiraceae bacterium HYJII51-Mn-bac16s-1-B09]|uniref:OmpA family protein n=2 Tax=Candidatus Manganitrophus noduliformans TaxID=2606439 RepID=A0A7X6DQ36_9BACT|nr:OmpA family protein [Candidatus Manganitrophus noduliformans]